ncbi:MAG: AI-2E family transporter [Candidatus Limnocylindrales bacterium]
MSRTMEPGERTVTARGGADERPGIPSRRGLLAAGTGVLLLVIALAVLDTITPFVVGLLLIYLLAPAVDRLARVRLGRRTIPRWLAILLLYLVIVAVLVIGLRLVVGPMSDQIQRFAQEAPGWLDSVRTWYQGLELPEWLRSGIDRIAEGVTSDGEGEQGTDIGSLLPIARSLASTLISTFGYLIIPFWVFWVLKDLPGLSRSFEHAMPMVWRRDAFAVLGIVDHTFGRWIRGQLILGMVVGIATFAGLIVLGELVDPVFLSFAVLLAIVAGLLELVPVIGPILSMIPTLVLALATDDPVRAAIAVVALYLIVQQLENHILVPKIQGDAVELHPSIVILALIVGSALFGLMGAILSVPVTAAARDIYRYCFRRLSEDDPDIPDPDAPDMARKTGREPVVQAPATGEQTEATATP